MACWKRNSYGPELAGGKEHDRFARTMAGVEITDLTRSHPARPRIRVEHRHIDIPSILLLYTTLDSAPLMRFRAYTYYTLILHNDLNTTQLRFALCCMRADIHCTLIARIFTYKTALWFITLHCHSERLIRFPGSCQSQGSFTRSDIHGTRYHDRAIANTFDTLISHYEGTPDLRSSNVVGIQRR